MDGYGYGVVMGAWLRQGNVRQARAILQTGTPHITTLHRASILKNDYDDSSTDERV